jgi:hypothetical protein
MNRRRVDLRKNHLPDVMVLGTPAGEYEMERHQQPSATQTCTGQQAPPAQLGLRLAGWWRRAAPDCSTQMVWVGRGWDLAQHKIWLQEKFKWPKK